MQKVFAVCKLDFSEKCAIGVIGQIFNLVVDDRAGYWTIYRAELAISGSESVQHLRMQ